MAYALDLVDSPITCHCWNKDGTQLALCPNTCDLLIYEVKGRDAKLIYTLSEHTQVISSCDWNYVTGQLVTCSHDRNAYVWELDEKTKVWKKNMVLLKLNRAATYVRWSPDGKKFTVATGHNKFRVCTYDQKQNWWQSYNISNGHPTSLNVEFMPDNVHIICAATDRHFGFYTIDEENGKIELDKKGKKTINFCLHEFSAQGWVNACTVSPSGNWIVYTSQDAFIKFIKSDSLPLNEKDKKNQFNISGLPLLSLCFISDNALIGGGFDCQPRLFVLSGDKWEDKGFIDVEGVREKAKAGGGGGLAAKKAMFGGPKVTKVETLHNNIIVGVRKTGDNITTCANDGKIGIWPISAIKEHFKF
ncbi:protein 2 3 complex subunit [Tritrichomonas musculus]|uniref:Arp2/3 complex 41 kDa subunit n=1 Tax=Tritrichomonas musculus TaxID=1915356 RepID=A0ABR2JV73_9EUKA